jgi:hypothetical protein
VRDGALGTEKNGERRVFTDAMKDGGSRMGGSVWSGGGGVAIVSEYGVS